MLHFFPPYNHLLGSCVCLAVGDKSIWKTLLTISHPDLFSPAVFKAWWERYTGVEKDNGPLKRGVVERGKRAPSPVVAQGVGKAEDWQQAPKPELGVGLGHGAWVKGTPGIQSVVYTDHLPGSGLLPIQPV